MNSPKIIYLHNDVRKEILDQYPDITNLVSDFITEDTTIIVRPDISEIRVQRDIGGGRGVMTLHTPAFHSILKSLRNFVNKYKEGSNLKESSLVMIEEITKGYKYESHRI